MKSTERVAAAAKATMTASLYAILLLGDVFTLETWTEICMKDAESAEPKEKSDFSDLYFSCYGHNLVIFVTLSP